MNKLIKSNLRFVVSVAKQYQNQGLTLEDPINEGNIGLIKAAQRFDSTKGFKFISYYAMVDLQTIMIALVENCAWSAFLSIRFHSFREPYRVNLNRPMVVK